MRKRGMLCKVIGGVAGIGVFMIIIGILMGGMRVIKIDMINGVYFNMSKVGFDINLVSDNDFGSMQNLDEWTPLDCTTIREVVFEAGCGDISIVGTSAKEYEFEVEKGEDQVRYKVEGDTLYVRAKNKKIINVQDDLEMIFYVPKSSELERFNITVGAGNLDCIGLPWANDYYISIGAGKASFDVLKGNTITMMVGAGEGVVENVLCDKGDYEVGVGKMRLNSSEPKDMIVDCGLGEVLLEFSKDINYKLDVGLGSIIVNDKKYSNLDEDLWIDNESKYTLDMECGMGSIIVGYMNK